MLAAGVVQHRADLLDGLETMGNDPDARRLILEMPDAQLQFGGSQIIGPDASVIAQAGSTEEMIFADLDTTQIAKELTALDTDGHYARPDVFELHVDTRVKQGVNWIV